MKYNKNIIRIDENGILHPVYNKSGWYVTPDYCYSILVIFQNQNIESLSFELSNYIVTILSKDISINKKRCFRKDESKYWTITSDFVDGGGSLDEFLYDFYRNERMWLDHPNIKFEEITQ